MQDTESNIINPKKGQFRRMLDFEKSNKSPYTSEEWEELKEEHEEYSFNFWKGIEERMGKSKDDIIRGLIRTKQLGDTWKLEFPSKYEIWRENLTTFLNERKLILPDIDNFAGWYLSYHEDVLMLRVYEIFESKISSNHFKLYAEYQALIFDGFTEEEAILKQRESVNMKPTPPPPAEGKDQGKSNYPAIVIMAVAQIIDNIEGKSFLPKEETNYKERVEKTKTAIFDKLKITVGNSIGNHFNPLEKLTKSHRKKIVELLNIKDYTQQAKDFELKIIATNR
jgi:hypothetical protein